MPAPTPPSPWPYRPAEPWGAFVPPPCPLGIPTKCQMQGVGTQPGPGHGNNGSSPCVWGGCTRVWQACARAQVILHVGVGARGPGCRVCACMGLCAHGTRVCELLRVCPVLCSHSVGQGGRRGLAVPCHTVSHRVVPCHTALCHVMPCHTVPCHLMPCRASPAPLSLPCPPWEAPIGVVLPQSGCPHAGSPQHSVPPPLLGPSRGSPRGGGCCPPAPRLQPPPFYSDLHVF